MGRKRKITPDDILTALDNGGEYLSRLEIAKAIGKAQLNPVDIKILNEFVESGKVEIKAEKRGIADALFYRKA